MKTFFTKLFIFVMLLLAPLFLIPNNPHDYYLALQDKTAHLKKSPSPRLILIGGSNLMFAVNSDEIQKYSGYHVTTMGLNASLGLRLMLDQVKPLLRSGDQIIVVPEYEHFFGDFLEGDLAIADLFRSDPSSIKNLKSLKQYQHLLQYLPYLYQSKLGFDGIKPTFLKNFKNKNAAKRWQEIVYDRNAFNEWGDNIANDSLNPPGVAAEGYRESLGALNMHTIEFLNQTAQALKRKNIQLTLYFPPYEKNEYSKNEAAILKLAQTLHQKAFFKVVGQPKDNIYSAENFFDSRYHLNRVGRKTYTDSFKRQFSQTNSK